MKALIYKDFVSAKSTYLVQFAAIVALGVYASLKQMLVILPIVLAFIPLFLNSVSFVMEEEAAYYKFIFTTPCSRRSYVLSKFVLGIIFALLAGFFGILIYPRQIDDVGLAVLLTATVFAGCLILNAWNLLFLFKYGGQKGRIFWVVSYFVIFGLGSLLGALSEALIAWLTTRLDKPYILAATIIVLGLATTAGSLYGSVKILQNKEY